MVEKGGRLLNFEQRANVSKAWRAGREWKDWYEGIYDEARYQFGWLAEVFVSVLAITSANQTVTGNITLAYTTLERIQNGEREFNKGYLPNVRSNLRALMAGEAVRGRKIVAFRDAMLGAWDSVVVDRWILRAYMFPNMTARRYDLIEADIRRRSVYAKVTPAQYQAGLWAGVQLRQGIQPGQPFVKLLRERRDR